MIRDLPAATVRASALRKGFRLDKKAGGGKKQKKDHLWFYFYGSPSMPRKDIRNNSRALKIPGTDLYRILDCTHSAERTRQLFEESLERTMAPEDEDEVDAEPDQGAGEEADVDDVEELRADLAAKGAELEAAFQASADCTVLLDELEVLQAKLGQVTKPTRKV